MGSIAPLMESLIGVLGIPPLAYAQAVDGISDLPFGHLAGGRDREGRMFCTAYYEV